MTDSSQAGPVDRLAPWRSWLDRPLSAGWCVIGWLVSTALFMGIVELGGGPSPGDSQITSDPTWAIAHGQLTCAFPRGTSVAPLYPMLSAGFAAATRIGHTVAFPSGSALGPSCTRALTAIELWSRKADALHGTLVIGYVGWVVLLSGVVALLRVCGRGRRVWEPATLVVIACLPPVWMCLETYFHPQDLVAMGFALASMACARKNAWIWAGILIALAVLSQQFAVLVAVPLLVVAPPIRRPHFALAAVATAVVVTLPLLVASVGRDARDVFLGTSDVTYNHGTLIAALHLRGAPLFALSRLTPLVLSLLLGIWVVRRLGRAAVLDPVPFVSLVALSLSLRLLFDSSLYGYYFLPLAVTLVLLDVGRGRLRSALVAWLILVSMACLAGPNSLDMFLRRVYWGHLVREVLPPTVLLLAVVMIGLSFSGHGRRRDLLVWVALAAGAAFAWASASDGTAPTLTMIGWQLVLVVPGMALAARPLRDRLREPAPSDARPSDVTMTGQRAANMPTRIDRY
jgi:Glycosyltransferase family 87